MKLLILGGLWLSFLLIAAVFDRRTKSVPGWLMCYGAVMSVAGCFFSGISWTQRGIGIGVGILFCIFSAFGKQAVGWCDSLIILMMGISLGADWTLLFLGIALALVMVAAIYLFVRNKVGRKDTLPFCPFLFLGFCVGIGGYLCFKSPVI